MYVTDVIRGNNKEAIEDCTEAHKDCMSAARFWKYCRGCVGELELMMMCTRLYRSLQGCANSFKVAP